MAVCHVILTCYLRNMQVEGDKKVAMPRIASVSELQFPSLSPRSVDARMKGAMVVPPCLNLMSSTSPCAGGGRASQPQHPSSMNLMAKPRVQLEMPDLELKMSTSRLSDQPGPSRSMPFFGTIRVT